MSINYKMLKFQRLTVIKKLKIIVDKLDDSGIIKLYQKGAQ